MIVRPYRLLGRTICVTRSFRAAFPSHIHRLERNAWVIEKGATMADDNDTAGHDDTPREQPQDAPPTGPALNYPAYSSPQSPSPYAAPAQQAAPQGETASPDQHTQNHYVPQGHSAFFRDQAVVEEPQQQQAFEALAAADSPADQPGSRRGLTTGTFLSGLAVAALVGGIVGGGVSSLVIANSGGASSAVNQQGGTVTLNNPESVTEISGVASVAMPSVVTLSVQSQSAAGSGSGVIYSEDGYIITNAHVVTLDGASSNPGIRVKLSDGRMLDGQLVGVAPYSDIAVVKVEAEGLTPIEVAESSRVNVGDLAVAIGAPMSLSNTVTSGVVSALNRGISVGSPLIPSDPQEESQEPEDGSPSFPWDFRFETPGQEQNPQQSVGQVTLPVIQTDASINPGNSGGALLNNRGELIGINVAIASPGASEGTASSAGLGFAIPAELATRVADEIIAGEKPSHGLLGASVADSSLDTDADANHAGGLVRELVRGGAAMDAGLRVGDVITAINGVPAADGTSVSALIRMHAGGSEATVDYTRNGVPGQTEVTLGTLDW